MRRDGGDLRKGAQDFGVEAAIGFQVAHLDPQQIFDRAGDVVAFPDLRGGQAGALEIGLRLVRVARQADRDIGGKARIRNVIEN